MSILLQNYQIGSSPRSWGTHRGSCSQLKPYRFIPTVVGNTSITITASEQSAVHPHGRGEHPFSLFKQTGYLGSSPRSWGTPISGGLVSIFSRFIPTVVGNTKLIKLYGFDRTVHPHGRGEHRIDWICLMALRGSSPRSWGTLAIQGIKVAS